MLATNLHPLPLELHRRKDLSTQPNQECLADVPTALVGLTNLGCFQLVQPEDMGRILRKPPAFHATLARHGFVDLPRGLAEWTRWGEIHLSLAKGILPAVLNSGPLTGPRSPRRLLGRVGI